MRRLCLENLLWRVLKKRKRKKVTLIDKLRGGDPWLTTRPVCSISYDECKPRTLEVQLVKGAVRGKGRLRGREWETQGRAKVQEKYMYMLTLSSIVREGSAEQSEGRPRLGVLHLSMPT